MSIIHNERTKLLATTLAIATVSSAVTALIARPPAFSPGLPPRAAAGGSRLASLGW